MIYDQLENLNQYSGMFETLDIAIEFLEDCDLQELPLGRTEIDEENGIYLMITEETTQPREKGLFETHSNSFQLHTELRGSELVEIALGDLQGKEPYREETDTALWQADCSAACSLEEGCFLLCMTEEPFKPLIAAAGGSSVKKCVVIIPRDMAE